MRSGEHLVSSESGVHKVCTVRRVDPSTRWSVELVKGIKGTPKEPVPGQISRRITAYAKKRPEADQPTPTATYVPQPEVETEVRALPIRKMDIETYGRTVGCTGCRQATNSSTGRSKHTADCRKRFEEELSKDEIGAKRVRRADHRMVEAIVRASELQQNQDGTAAGGDSSMEAEV